MVALKLLDTPSNVKMKPILADGSNVTSQMFLKIVTMLLVLLRENLIDSVSALRTPQILPQIGLSLQSLLLLRIRSNPLTFWSMLSIKMPSPFALATA